MVAKIDSLFKNVQCGFVSLEFGIVEHVKVPYASETQTLDRPQGRHKRQVQQIEDIKFLADICKGYAKFVLFLESVAYHKSKVLKEFLAGGSEIKAVYFPSCAQNLNPRGPIKDAQKIHWKLPVPNVDEMQKPMRTILKRKEIPVVKIRSYLRR